jgi:hypothetical protein
MLEWSLMDGIGAISLLALPGAVHKWEIGK